MLKIWKELNGKNRSEVFLGAVQKIYLKQRISEIEKPKISKLFLTFEENEFSSNNQEKMVSINFKIHNSSKFNMFLRVETHFWKTSSNENIPLEFIWLRPQERVNSKIKTTINSSQTSGNLRLDFRIWEVGESEHLIHKTLNYNI